MQTKQKFLYWKVFERFKRFFDKIVPKKKNNLCIVRFIVHIKCYNETTKGKHNLERKGDNKNDKRYKRDQKREHRT